MKINSLSPGLVGQVPRSTSYASRDDAGGRGRVDPEARERFVERASSLQEASKGLARASMASQRVVTIGHTTSSRSLDLNEAPHQSGSRAPRTVDSRRPMAQVPALSGVRRGDFSINGYQIEVDPFTDSLSDVLSRIELTSPNTRATFSAASNRVLLATRSDRKLVLADGEAAFLQAISVLPGRFTGAEAAQDAKAAEDAARAAEAARSAQAAQQGGSDAQSAAAEQTVRAAEATAQQSAQTAERAAAQAEIASAITSFQESFNQFAAIEEPLVTYDNAGRVSVAASGRTQLDRVVSAAFDRAGLQGGSPASARFDVSPDLSFRFDNPRSVMQVDVQAVASGAVQGGSEASRFLFGDPAEGSKGIVQELGSRLGDVLKLARGETPNGASPVPVA